MMVSFFRIITHVLGENSAQFDFFPLAFGYVMLLIPPCYVFFYGQSQHNGYQE